MLYGRRWLFQALIIYIYYVVLSTCNDWCAMVNVTRLAYYHPDLEADLCISANHVRSTERLVLPAKDERPIALMFEPLLCARTIWIGIKVFGTRGLHQFGADKQVGEIRECFRIAVTDGCECNETVPCIIGACLNPVHKVLQNLVDSSTMDSMDVVVDAGVVGVLDRPRENQTMPAATRTVHERPYRTRSQASVPPFYPVEDCDQGSTSCLGRP